jgi:hypothetical protein
LNLSAAMESPPQKEKPPKGYSIPLEAFFTSPSAKFSHNSLQKVEVKFCGD